MAKKYKLTNNLKRIRRGYSELTQLQLADEVGCSRQTIAALEKGIYNPSLKLALRISMVLNVPVEEIFSLLED